MPCAYTGAFPLLLFTHLLPTRSVTAAVQWHCVQHLRYPCAPSPPPDADMPRKSLSSPDPGGGCRSKSARRGVAKYMYWNVPSSSTHQFARIDLSKTPMWAHTPTCYWHPQSIRKDGWLTDATTHKTPIPSEWYSWELLLCAILSRTSCIPP